MITVTVAGATESIIKPIPFNQVGVPFNNEDHVIELKVVEIPYWEFLLWLVTVYVLAMIDYFYPKRLFFSILGYRIVNPGNVLENSSRFKVYGFIKTKPGAYISEIVEHIGLDRETVKYHIKTLKAKNKIEAYKDGGKTRYFENLLVYNEDEKKVISALQNLKNQGIISVITTGKCNTNVALAREFGVSKATISWHMKNLREIDLIIEVKEGKNTIYKINPVYRLLIEKYTKPSIENIEPHPLTATT